jgi:hypothetical protein
MPLRDTGPYQEIKTPDKRLDAFLDLITPMFPLAEEALKTLGILATAVMPGLDPAIQLSN